MDVYGGASVLLYSLPVQKNVDDISIDVCTNIHSLPAGRDKQN